MLVASASANTPTSRRVVTSTTQTRLAFSLCSHNVHPPATSASGFDAWRFCDMLMLLALRGFEAIAGPEQVAALNPSP